MENIKTMPLAKAQILVNKIIKKTKKSQEDAAE